MWYSTCFRNKNSIDQTHSWYNFIAAQLNFAVAFKVKYYIDYLLENPPIEKRRHFLLSNYGSALGLVRLIVRNLITHPHSLNCYPD